MYKSPRTVMLEYIPLRIIMELFAFLPMIFIILFAKVIGSLIYYLSPNTRKVALINLKQAFPEKSFRERKKIAKRSIQTMIMTFSEFIKASKMSDKRLLKRITAEGIDKFDKALYDKNIGIIAITGHIGNWEYVASYFGLKGYNPHVIVRPLDNPKLNAHLESWREKRGAKCISRWGDLRAMFEALKENKPVAFLADQNFLDGIFVEFFGCLCKTATGPIALAMKTKAPIAILYDVPNRYGYHKVVVSEIMYIEEKESKEETIRHNTQRYTKKLEDIIRKYPENWLWVHPRWNTRPNGEAEVFYKHNNFK